MQVSDEIIKVLEYLGEKLGVTIDWTSNNVLPYVEKLCSNFIKWEIGTSIAWIVIGIIIAIISIVIAKMDLAYAEVFFFIVGMGAAISIIGTQTFDIIECCTFPEKTIYDYIQLHFGSSGR